MNVANRWARIVLGPRGGGRGIRTLGGFHHAGFQDQCIRPLCHPSVDATNLVLLMTVPG